MNTSLVRFVIVGATATLTTYVILILLVEGLSFNPVVASAFGYIGGAIINYVLNYYYTFKSTQFHHVTLPKFVLIIFIGFLLNTAVMYCAESIFYIHYFFSQLVAVFVVLVWSFVANRFWTFV